MGIDNGPEQTPVAPKGSQIVLARRVLYYAMHDIAGLEVNPNEIWHYGKGDPLSEYVSGTYSPYYGVVEVPQWYAEEMRQAQS